MLHPNTYGDKESIAFFAYIVSLLRNTKLIKSGMAESAGCEVGEKSGVLDMRGVIGGKVRKCRVGGNADYF